jgi:hypothetical protein
MCCLPLQVTLLSIIEKDGSFTFLQVDAGGLSKVDLGLGPPYFFSLTCVIQNNVIGQLFVKYLIFIDPEDAVSIRSFVQIFGRGVHVVIL